MVLIVDGARGCCSFNLRLSSVPICLAGCHEVEESLPGIIHYALLPKFLKGIKQEGGLNKYKGVRGAFSPPWCYSKGKPSLVRAEKFGHKITRFKSKTSHLIRVVRVIWAVRVMQGYDG